MNEVFGKTQSATILHNWAARCDDDYKTIVDSINNKLPNEIQFSLGQFKHWVSTKDIQGTKQNLSETQGLRMVAIINYFLEENKSKINLEGSQIVYYDELKELVAAYQTTTPTNKLRLAKLLNEYEIDTGQREAIISPSDWRTNFAKRADFSFVYDSFWCMRAVTKYCLAIINIKEEDLQDWGFWQRILAKKENVNKLQPESELRRIHGKYSESYYKIQIRRFRQDMERYKDKEPERFQNILRLLQKEEGFKELWEQIENNYNEVKWITQVETPFYGNDGTLALLVEIKMPMTDLEGHFLGMWTPADKDTDEYLIEFRHRVDKLNIYSRDVYFIEDYMRYFTQDELSSLKLE